MKDFLRGVPIYFAYFQRFLLARMEYKFDFFFGIFANILTTMTGLLFIFFLVDGKAVPSIGGWKREEVLFIYGYASLSLAILSTLAANLYGFASRYIVLGQFDRVLLRPLSTLCQILFESFNLDSIGGLLTGAGVLIYASNELNLTFGAIDILWLLLSAFSGGVILISVFVVVASLSFHFEDRFGIAPPVFNLLNFGRYPTPIFNRIIQFLLSFVIPFAFVGFYPATHFLDRPGFEIWCYSTPLMACACAAVAGAAWRFGVSRYESTGS